MTVRSQTTAEKMAKYLKPKLSGDPRVVGLWYRQYGPEAQFWLLVDLPTLEAERELRSFQWDLLDRFPDTLVDFFVGNVRLGSPESLRQMVPEDAESIHL